MTFLTSALGLLGAMIAALAASRAAAAAERRPAAALGVCGFVIAILAYGGVLQALVLFVHPKGALAASMGPEAVFAAFAVLAALAAAVTGGGAIYAWLAISGNQAGGRFRTAGLSLLFSLAVTILAAPFLIQNQMTIERSIDANEAEIEAFKMSYTSGLEKLTALGALSRIEIGDDAVTHYIGGPLYKVGEEGLAEYARAAMIYHTHILGRPPMPVVLRDSATEAKIGTFRIDNVFVLHMAALPTANETAGPPQAAAAR